MERKWIELGKLIVDDSLKQLEESERMQRAFQSKFERQRKRLMVVIWMFTIVLLAVTVALLVWLASN